MSEFEGCTAKERKERTKREIDYCKLLNANLPNDIQVLAWAPCSNTDFSARFDCVARTYKYFFPRGDLCLDKMNEAGQLFVGEHDFRNFCKMDVAHGVVNYQRSIKSVDAKKLHKLNNEPGDAFDMCELEITGKAFLWHQVRCIVAVLFRVASGREDKKIVSELLDVDSNPRRPQYSMASEFPLNLFACVHDPSLDWQIDLDAVETTTKQLQELWTEHAVKAEMLKSALRQLGENVDETKKLNTHTDCLYGIGKMKQYTMMCDMVKCPSLDEKLNAPSSKRRKMNLGTLEGTEVNVVQCEDS